MNVCKIAGRVAKRVDTDQPPGYVASDLGLHFAQTRLSEYVDRVSTEFDQSEPLRNHPGSAPPRM